MDQDDIPIFKKTYELYKLCYGYRSIVPKQDRHALWQRCENGALDILEGILLAKQMSQTQKRQSLEQVSLTLNVLRTLFRLAKDTRCIDLKKYTNLQIIIDEIGRMLGGWIKSKKEKSTTCPPPEGLRTCDEMERNSQAQARPMFGFGLSSQLLLKFS